MPLRTCSRLGHGLAIPCPGLPSASCCLGSEPAVVDLSLEAPRLSTVNTVEQPYTSRGPLTGRARHTDEASPDASVLKRDSRFTARRELSIGERSCLIAREHTPGTVSVDPTGHSG
jgi:hypothetical protein